MIYGKPVIHVDDDQTDRIGLRTLILSQLWQPSRWPLSPTELDGEKPDVPEVPGGIMLIGEQTRRVGGALRTAWTFEGIAGDGQNVTFKDRTHSLDYGFEPGFAEKSILSKWNIQSLLDQYGGLIIDNQVSWPEILPEKKGSGPAKDSGAGRPNPMYGQNTFFDVSGTYHFRYAAASLGGMPNTAGRIFESGSLPGRAPVFPGRNWLGLPPAPTRCGPIYEIVETYWLSGDGGWPEVLYSGSSKNSGPGLVTGHLSTATDQLQNS